VEIMLIDEPSNAQEDRAEIARESHDTEQRAAVKRMAARMRDRDDEDLALEQLEHVQTAEQSRASVADIGEQAGSSSIPQRPRRAEPRWRTPNANWPRSVRRWS
jgi:hypothetical protein